jgi:ATP-dependent Lhr-like helicase
MITDAPSAPEYLGPPCSAAAVLDTLAGPVRSWFLRHFEQPTLVQRLVWPALAAGRHLLVCAPTGTGKTLAVFLPILSDLCSHAAESALRCCYVSPLKALTNDTRRTLKRALAEIAPDLPEGAPAPRVAARTGDTSARARRQLLIDPPAILLTTPESLAVLLTQRAAAEQFAGMRWVVVDELHALAGNKRGADLALSLERLADIAGNRLQRIGLSATCTPLTTLSQFLVGAGNPCAIAAVEDDRPFELRVEPLPEAMLPARGLVAQVVVRVDRELDHSPTTLIFTNTRSLAERLAWVLRRRRPDWAEQIGVHHSALAARRRHLVERDLKRGRLRVVVSSSSLELGVDIGGVEQVVFVHPPGGVVRLLQRLGRSGHGPGRVRRGLVLTSSASELLEAAVTGASSRTAQLEPLQVCCQPLDVLCQQLLGMAALRAWTPEEAYALARQAYPFRELSWDDFQGCLDYLLGRTRRGEPWLPARIAWFDGRFVAADDRTVRLLRRNLGTILAPEQRAVRLESGHAVGQVEDAFAERLQPGDRFLLDGRCLELRRTENRALLVEEIVGRPLTPRWTGEGWPLSQDLAQRLFLLRQLAAEALRDGPEALRRMLRDEFGLDGEANALVAQHLQLQETVSEIPDTQTLLIECVWMGQGTECYLHTPLHRTANHALAHAAIVRIRRERGLRIASLAADLGVMLWIPEGPELTPDFFRRLLAPADFDADLTSALQSGEMLRERFRRVATTGLMLLRNPLGRRRRVGGPDWAERQLFEQVQETDPECVLLRQSWREVRSESVDVEAAWAYLLTLPNLDVRCRWLGQPSPFAASWTQMSAGTIEIPAHADEVLLRLHESLTATTYEPEA